MASRTSIATRSEKSSKSVPPRRKPSPSPSPARRNVSRPAFIDEDEAPGRVRVSVRLRPKTAEEHASDADFADFVELHPELKRLVIRKNSWTSEAYKFDDIFPETASQKRVYDGVAKPVVESALNGYNGTVMAYGQTGTGKTYTLGHLGKLDPSERGIMVRALEDILSNTLATSTSTSDMVAISYLQLYMETLHDLLSPEKSNISIVEDPKTGEVSLPGSTIVKIRDIDHAMQLLEIGERNRCTSNTKFNTESSRSHAILVVFVQRRVKERGEGESSLSTEDDVPIILKSKLLIVDLAGSERMDKSGGEGHTLEEAKSINLSLTSLGKCINAIAENSPHIPTRDSKITRLLRDSFGGSSRTSLIVTIGPSGRYIGETTSTLMFGQRAMKIENVIKLREEFDYEALCRKLELRLDYLTAEHDREKKLRDMEKRDMENKLKDCELRLTETQKNLVVISESSFQEKHLLEEQFNCILSDLNIQRERHQLMCEELENLQLSLRCSRMEMQKHVNELSILSDPQADCLTLQSGLVKEEQLGTMNMDLQDKKLIDFVSLEISACQKVFAGTTQFYQAKISDLVQQLEDECTNSNSLRNECLSMKRFTDQESSRKTQEQTELEEMRKKFKELHMLHENALKEVQRLRLENEEVVSSMETLNEEKELLHKKLSEALLERNTLKDEILKLKNATLTNNSTYERMKSHGKENSGKVAWGVENLSGKFKAYQPRDTIFVQRATMAKIFEEVGLPKILALLQCDDLDMQIHAVKVVANLAAEDANQEKIVSEGGLDALLLLLDSSQNETIRRVASGAIANLAMNEKNQSLIMSRGGGKLLSNMPSKTEDSQTQRMVAGAVANLCGNEKLHVKLKEDGGIKALLEMAKSGHSDVIAQVARGFANFAKCESRGGYRNGQSLLIEDGALTWMMENASCNSTSTRRHIELAFCHLAQHEENSKSIVSSGALRELIHIASESAREDIRNLAKKVINTSPALRAEIQRHNSAYV